MCGIVGVAGSGRAGEILIEGLKRLEYRGYDSAGIAILGQDGKVNCARAPGKVSSLLEEMGSMLEGATGIAHTRWATHGAPTQANAHPHRAGRVSLVHNGIIENFKELRAELEAKGRVFASETDTEAVAHLLDAALETGVEPEQAWLSVLSRLEGAFALAAVIDGHPDLVLGARRGAPLIAAQGDDVGFLASDVMAITGEARSVIYLEEGDAAIVRPRGITVYDGDGQLAARQVVPAATSAILAEKGNHRHFMQKEIYEQPEVVGRTISAYLDAVSGQVRERADFDFSALSRLLIIGCGTASYAGQVAEYWFESLANLPVEVDIASEFRYRQPAFMEKDAALFISQSGETADTLEAMRMCKAAGLQTIVLVNTAHSTMAREADIVVPTLAGPEIGVASTKAFTCQLSALASLAVLAGVQRGRIDAAVQSELVTGLLALPGLLNASLQVEEQINTLANELSHASIVLYLGRNEFFPMALEGALKLKEISYIHAEGYAAGELKHGPIALIEDDVAVIVIAPYDALFTKTLSSIQEVKARGARVIAITDDEGLQRLEGEASAIITLPRAPALAAPIVSAMAVQLLAYYVAVHKGTDVDQPRNLAKSVTVE
ncbi:MAG: glutamine--fructose-6-phosphate transaminase (isomerizing) [Maricaulis sp.]|uniref:glutamine--fructose-6-phosphate transaminase (isomerizing) n=1 Tax=Maricaulis sp. TaxID=1486257 RepID=UPI0026023B5F|nr:glutamine--fructose-6-phosphate transaminase (isomerizing) [Maricaulis sp.]MDM7984930.1 glutamine--fructose-6-phosphate transaminase (isomerizing) [Maricaulis sp.]